MNLILPGRVSEWSFGTAVPPPRPDCNCHFVFLATGTPDAAWTFELTLPLRTPLRNSLRQPEAAVAAVDSAGHAPTATPTGGRHEARARESDEVIFYGHYLEARTPLLEEAEAALPEWVTPISWASVLGTTVLDDE